MNNNKVKIKQLNERPTVGQFVGVWSHNGKIWANTYKWIDGILMMYQELGDDFIKVSPLNESRENSAVYFIGEL